MTGSYRRIVQNYTADSFAKIKTMKPSLSVVMITHDSDELLERVLASVKPITNEIIVIDDGSTDRTVAIAQSHRAKIHQFSSTDLGRRKAYGIAQATKEWILILDADEVVSPMLAVEIREVLKKRLGTDVYYIPYKNHFLGKVVRYGGERYAMPRLFKKKKAKMKDALVHEQIMFDMARASCLHSPIWHYSYRSLSQVFMKFTNYALREARQKKKNGEKTSLKKIFLYPVHMVWARFIEDRGYKDGLFRLPLDIGFGYMEFLTYASMLFIK